MTTPSNLAVLRDAVERQETARGRLRTDPDRALEIWMGLVAGRWSLVDRYEKGGRRYLVARRNESDVSEPAALTSRERAVARLAAIGLSNKWIAYELGLSASTVATHLAFALRKLKLKTRTELASTISAVSKR